MTYKTQINNTLIPRNAQSNTLAQAGQTMLHALSHHSCCNSMGTSPDEDAMLKMQVKRVKTGETSETVIQAKRVKRVRRVKRWYKRLLESHMRQYTHSYTKQVNYVAPEAQPQERLTIWNNGEQNRAWTRGKTKTEPQWVATCEFDSIHICCMILFVS